MIMSSPSAPWGVDWVTLLKKLPMFGLVIFAFASGGWVTSIRDQSVDLPYKDRATTQLENLQQVAGQNPAATVQCLKRKANVAENVAVKAVVSNYTSEAPPNLAQIPDCPPLPKPKK